MPALKDITGQRFGRLVVLSRQGSDKHKKALWLCQCDCGNTTVAGGSSMLCGNTSSCGCIHKEQLIERNSSHGLCKTSEYYSWANMVDRCTNKNNDSFEYYGGRGITVTDKWKSFENFYSDMGQKPSELYTLERIDNNGNYEPGNCRWATRKEQANNKRNNRRETHNGKTQTLAQWAAEVGISRSLLFHRLKNGMSMEEALTTAVKKRSDTLSVVLPTS